MTEKEKARIFHYLLASLIHSAKGLAYERVEY